MIDGLPITQPTLLPTPGKRGKSAVCCFCGHVHPLETLKRMMRDGLKDDVMLVVQTSTEPSVSAIGNRWKLTQQQC